MKNAHPLFHRAAEEHRYTGELKELLAHLRPLAWKAGKTTNPMQAMQDRDFAWIVLPRGAVVGLRFRMDDMRRELRIARTERPEGQKGAQAWQQEVEVFLRHFGITALDGHTPSDGTTGWHAERPHPNDEAKPGIAVRFLELRAGEITPGKARCAKCWDLAEKENVVEWHPTGGIAGQACQAHAVVNGNAAVKDTAERQLRLVP